MFGVQLYRGVVGKCEGVAVGDRRQRASGFKDAFAHTSEFLCKAFNKSAPDACHVMFSMVPWLKELPSLIIMRRWKVQYLFNADTAMKEVERVE